MLFIDMGPFYIDTLFFEIIKIGLSVTVGIRAYGLVHHTQEKRLVQM